MQDRFIKYAIFELYKSRKPLAQYFWNTFINIDGSDFNLEDKFCLWWEKIECLLRANIGEQWNNCISQFLNVVTNERI